MPAVQPQVALPPRYRVVRHIANGGMAVVWAAEDELLERLVAVKVLGAGYAADPSARRRFTREARAAARVSDHPHVVTIYDIGEPAPTPDPEGRESMGQAFIVMEHFAGGTVADRLRGDDPVPVPTALDWLEQAASALDAAHAADIVHRDVKPGNLLLDERGRLAVGDFGIASIAGDTAMTQAGQVLGTAAYLSPEQARGRPATPASDRYSLAVVAYELLCGRRPFDGETPVAQARAHVEVEPPVPTGPCAAGADVLRRGLAKDPAQRPPTAAAFVADLRRSLGALAEPSRSGPPTEATRRMPVTGRGSGRFARAGAAGAAAGAAGAAAGAAGAAGEAAGAGAAAAGATSSSRREPPPEPVARERPARRAWPLAILALLCLAGGAAAALISDDGNGGADRAARKAEKSSPTRAADKPAKARKERKAAAPAATSTPAPTQSTPAPTDDRSPTDLNNAGFALLPGNPQAAIPLLQRAVTGFRESGQTGDVNYAYALYNLGWALRLADRPAEAIPYLEERLRISDYKRGVVEQELATAREAAGQTSGGEPAPSGKGNGKAKGHKKDD